MQSSYYSFKDFTYQYFLSTSEPSHLGWVMSYFKASFLSVAFKNITTGLSVHKTILSLERNRRVTSGPIGNWRTLLESMNLFLPILRRICVSI